MHLRSVTLKGFKSFPDRTKLDFSPGVSVVVGPNGSGKSNITDALLWALGEQSPVAVRGQTMADVIFAGGAGVASRNAAEVEVVIEDAGPSTGAGFSELSIVRRLDRDGGGEYRMNGARCRLVDVIEALSDTGLGKEMHSVVSQGRVESIIHSKPRDRRMLIEEAAGLGKHRKRRRRAELKLERTQQNLDRALDVEREARSRLRPLKRQAEAAELHARLEHQTLEARHELARERVRALEADLAAAESVAAAARRERDAATGDLGGVARAREAAEQAFAEQSRAREALSGRHFATRAALERIALRAERASETALAAEESRERREAELDALRRAAAHDAGDEIGARVAALEAELGSLDQERHERMEKELEQLRADLLAAEERSAAAAAAVDRQRRALAAAEEACGGARAAAREAERGAEAARSESARIGARLAAANQFIRTAAAGRHGVRPLADGLIVHPGFERAAAAALGPRLTAGLVEGIAEGEALLDAAGEDGATALVPPDDGAAGSPPPGRPCPGAEPLAGRVRGDGTLAPLVARLLHGVWLVDSLSGLPDGFRGVAVTRGGRLWSPATGELHQAAAGGEERLLEQRNLRDELALASEAAAGAERSALERVEASADAVTSAEAARDEARAALRDARRIAEDAAERVALLRRQIERRREAPDEGDAALARGRVQAELAAERRLAERVGREAAERKRRIAVLSAGIERDRAVNAAAVSAAAALVEAAEAGETVRESILLELSRGEKAGERTAAELRRFAHEEAQIHERLRKTGDALTTAEVRAQQVRDGAREAAAELAELSGRLGFEPEAAGEPLPSERHAELEARIERLGRRREQLGPVNPLAKAEYDDAVCHVEELEAQRSDLEAALTELEKLIRETDRRIREAFEETFEAAARNFEEVVQDLFPGGRGRLRLVRPEGPRPVLGGEQPDGTGGAAEHAAEAEEAPPSEDPGVEVEVTPAGKSMKRLSLLSGGEKSLVALAFIFAVFLARPCPFYVLDEVEAALDDLNIDRFLQLVRRYSDRAQFIIVTHQKRTMDAADCIYGVSMGSDGVSKVVSRRLAGGQRTLEQLESEAHPGDEAAA